MDHIECVVIGAGIYYPAGSLKARFCVGGKHMLYAYCAERGIPYSRLGKLIVAAEPGEVPVLDGIRKKAAINGVDDLEHLSEQDARHVEPALRAAAALLSPTPASWIATPSCSPTKATWSTPAAPSPSTPPSLLAPPLPCP